MTEFNVQELLKMLVELVLLPAIPVIVTYVVKTLKAHIEAKIADVNNKDVAEYLTQICDIISQVVTSTTQTYVDTLKAQGKFDANAQKLAFEKTRTAILSMLSEESRDLLEKLYGDVDTWLETKIEQEVKIQKIEL